MKKKIVAAVLAFPFGALGLHRFYLGQRFLGILYLAVLIFGISISEWEPNFLFAFIVPFIDAVLFYVMPRDEFNAKYNSGKVNTSYSKRSRKKRYDFKRPNSSDNFHLLKQSGIQHFRNYDYESAIEDFLDALEIRPKSAALHFNLACCYSIIEDDERAFLHLEEAVANGFNDLDKIHTHDALAYLRSSNQFDDFLSRGYRRKQTYKAPEPYGAPIEEEEMMAPQVADELLQQIIKLGELKEKGILTEEEYLVQKKRILGS
jgi:TM2 domain-containing membrane protein YozV